MENNIHHYKLDCFVGNSNSLPLMIVPLLAMTIKQLGGTHKKHLRIPNFLELFCIVRQLTYQLEILSMIVYVSSLNVGFALLATDNLGVMNWSFNIPIAIPYLFDFIKSTAITP